MSETETPNAGHGHVRPRPDGVKARCGGPAICSACKAELTAHYVQTGVHGPVMDGAQQSAAPVAPAKFPGRGMLRMVASAATRANEFSDDGPTQEPKP